MASTFRSNIGTTTPRSIKSDNPLNGIVGDIQKEVNAQFKAEIEPFKEVKSEGSRRKLRPRTRY